MSPSHVERGEFDRSESAAAAPLGNLFERLSGLEIIPRASGYAGLQFFEAVPPTPFVFLRLMGGFEKEPSEFSRYDLIFSRSGAALWLCCNATPLFVELGKVVTRKNASGRLDPLRLTTLIIDFLTTQTSGSSTIEQSKDLSTLMLCMGFGLLSVETDWGSRLKQLALAQAEKPGHVPVTPLIRWSIDIESEPARPAIAERQQSLEELLRHNPEITGFELNRWAYFLLSLQLFHAALPLAMRALVTAGKPEYFPERLGPLLRQDYHTSNLAAARDTLGWALCFAGRYDEAEKMLEQSLHGLRQCSSETLEVRYHLAHAFFWGGTPNRAVEWVRLMQEEDAENIWTKRAVDLIKTAPPSSASSETKEYDVVLSFAGEDRGHAEGLAKGLVAKGLKVFYDDFERSVLWGHNLYEYLTDLYQNRARYCVVLVSKSYANKRWTRLEWRAIQARCFRECEPYCLPIRLDATELPGLLPTTAYFSLELDGMDMIIGALIAKLGKK